MAGTPLRPTPGLVGCLLALTPAELDLAAEVTTVDTMLGRMFWWRYAPTRYVDILEAMEDE